MHRLNRTLVLFVSIVLATATACGGGGGGKRGVTGSDLTASFVADQAVPGAGSVSMAESSAAGDVVTVLVAVTDTTDIYGVAFDLTYDPDVASFRDWAPGTLLEQGGNAPNYTVVAAGAGTLVVGASRTGNVSGVDASGSATLVRLTFIAKRPGSTPISFESAFMTDDRIPPGEIAGVAWIGGTLVVE